MGKRAAELGQSLIDVDYAWGENYSPVTDGKPIFIVDRPGVVFEAK